VTDSDETFLNELRDLAGRVDPVPASLVAGAKTSFTWRTIDAELAELAYDSVVDERPLAGVRGAQAARVLTFSAPQLTIELEVTPAGELVHIVGQLVPAGPGSLELRHRGGVAAAEADELGRFAVAGVSAGPFSIRCTRKGDESGTVTTDWTTL
jgi:hypothetical protein